MSQRPPSARSASTPTASSSSSRPPATPFDHGQKNVWTDVIDANKAAAKERGDAGRPDAVLFVVGSKGCGKTTLVNRLLYPDKTETPKPTEGMEYNYARRTHATNIDRKDVAHVWEIAGSRQFADEVTEQDNVFLGARQVTTAVVCICVDLAKPTEAMRTAEYWLGRIHARCEKTFEKLSARGSRLPEQLRKRSERVFSANAPDGSHPDTSIRHSGVTVCIVATKHDATRRTDPERMKVLTRALRYLAHVNAAGLFFLGGFGKDSSSSSHSTSSADAPADEYLGEMRSQFNQFRAYLNHLIFVGADRRFPARLPTQLDHLRPVLCPIGGDRFSSIGAPKGVDGDGDVLRAWRDIVRRMFPDDASGGRTWVGAGFRGGDVSSGTSSGTSPDLSKYPEREVDATARTRVAELAAFLKSQAMLRAGGGERGGGSRPRSAAVR